MTKTLRQRIKRIDKILKAYHFKPSRTSFKVGDVWEINPRLTNFALSVSHETGTDYLYVDPGTKFFLFAEKSLDIFGERMNEGFEVAENYQAFSVLDLKTHIKYDAILDREWIKNKWIRKLTR